MKVYISGPITGVENFEEIFEQTEELLKADGFEVVNPVKVCCEMNNAKWIDYMRADITALMECDCLYAMEGWEKSKGASIEVNLARALGMRVTEE
jgi:nucleoside 2-deoxyribosyltransferase